MISKISAEEDFSDNLDRETDASCLGRITIRMTLNIKIQKVQHDSLIFMRCSVRTLAGLSAIPA
jgi:hypothetical protein